MAGRSHRCSECRKAFVPAPSARTKQLVCGKTCRRARRRKLARRRRALHLEDSRADDRKRQRGHRERHAAAAESHEPPSPRKPPISQSQIVDFVDRALALSRASLVREIGAMIDQMEPISGNEREVSRASLAS